MATLFSLAGLAAFIFLIYTVAGVKKEQKKSNLLLRKIYEKSGGELLQYEKDILEE